MKIIFCFYYFCIVDYFFLLDNSKATMNKSAMSKLIHPDLLNGPIFKTLIVFTFPIFVSYLFQQLYNAADTIIVGNYLSEVSLSAIGASAPLNDLIVGFGTGFGTGMGLVAAREYGAGDYKKLKKSVAASLILTLIITLLMMVTFYFSLKPLLRLLKTPEEIIDESYSYIIVICLFCGVMFLYNLASGLLRAIGNSFMPLLFLVLSSLLNIWLDILFITRFNMGIKGAAIATVIAQAVSALLCIIYIAFKAKILIPYPKEGHFKFDKKIYKDLAGQGLSMALMGSLVTSGTVILQSAINVFGKTIIAAHLASRKIFSIASIPIFTIGMASATVVSQNYGASKMDRVRKVVRVACIVTTVWSMILVISSRFVLRNLLTFISGSKQEELLEYGTNYLTFAFPFFIVLGVLIVLRNSLQGLGAKILPLLSSIIELAGKILFTIFVITKIGTQGIIMTEPLIWVAMCLSLLFAYIIRLKGISKNCNS